MENLKDIVKFLDTYLKTDEIEDRSWNGLQVEGKAKVNKIIFTENAGKDAFKKSLEKGGDLIVVHHGILWKNTNPSFRNWHKERISLLAKKEVSLYASHLPLDRHRKVGNNAQLLKLLGAVIKKEFLLYENKHISWIGEFKKPVRPEEIIKKLNSKLNTKCVSLLFGKKKIKTIALCSGSGGSASFNEALEKEVDLYLSGESPDVYTLAKDARCNAIFAGHYATETLGLKALMEVVKNKLKVKTLFIDIPTGL
jgi:dinuclear metal center YbgI/SA1388 family protein|tara:strand:+ start:2332 stop:3090 length:759 start_codon:yes stop_codon:yes gene_type:complete